MGQPTIDDIAKQRPDKRYIVQFTMISGIKYFHSTNINRNYDDIWNRGEPAGFVLPGSPRLILQVDEIESVIVMENANVNASESEEAKVPEEASSQSERFEAPGETSPEAEP